MKKKYDEGEAPKKVDKFYLQKTRFGKHWFRWAYFNSKTNIGGSTIAPNRDAAKRKIEKLCCDYAVEFYR